MFDTYQYAFKKGHCCQIVLLRLLEDRKKITIDEKKYDAEILMDLSKAFDCLPHDTHRYSAVDIKTC